MTIESPSKWHYSSDLLVFFLSRVIFFYSFFFGCCCWGNIFYLLSERWSDNQTATWQIWLKRCYFSFKKYYIFARIGNSSTKQSQKTIAKEKYKFVCIFFLSLFCLSDSMLVGKYLVFGHISCTPGNNNNISTDE